MPVRGSSEDAGAGGVPAGSDPAGVDAGGVPTTAEAAGAAVRAVDDDPGGTIRLLAQALAVKVAALADGRVDAGDRWWFTPPHLVEGSDAPADEPEPGSDDPGAGLDVGDGR